MINKEKAKEELIKLIKDFKNNPDYYKKLSEADVEDKLVNELFVNILGWDKKDYEKRAKARRGDKGGSADYAFKINERIVFFLEVKKVTIPLDKEADEQVILYSLSKKVPLAISTNFQQMNIFCVEQENAIQNVFRNFKTPEDYVNNFQDLLFLSKESFEQGLLLKKAEDEGRLKRRVSIDKVLLEDFWRVRTLIANDIEKNKPGKYNINEKDEIVQRILDRLIFIRRCEDIGINPENLTLEEIKHVAESRAYSQLKSLFTKYDSVYNSGLFTPNKDNDCDIITIDGSIIQKLISYLYESHDKKYKYNFEWIDADVLGQVYEQYLSKILSQNNSGKAKLKDSQAHKKEQGIYYTPTYIVDYIVKNTLGELLKDKKVDARKIKILDPACGSGSFLIKAFDYLNEHLSKDEEAKQHKLDFQGSYSVKTSILKDNIFGVDLDNKAVEITKLNLLLKAAEKFRKLPSELDNHIGWGNSLIDDNAFEHPFKWVGDFQEGTFDVVIGNPPYVFTRGQNFEQNEKDYYYNHYSLVQYQLNTYLLFVEKAIKLLRNNGIFGFIVPNTWQTIDNFSTFRRFLFEKMSDITIINVEDKVFSEANVDTSIIIFQKTEKSNKNVKLLTSNEGNFKSVFKGSSNDFGENNVIRFSNTSLKDENKIVKKIELQSKKLKEFSVVKSGLKAYEVGKGTPKQTMTMKDNRVYHSNRQIDKTYYQYLEGKNVCRYSLKWTGLYLKYGKCLAAPRTFDLFNSERILVRQIPSKPPHSINATYSSEISLNDINSMIIYQFKKSPKIILGLLNSKLMTYWFNIKFNKLQRGLFPQFKVKELEEFPIHKEIDSKFEVGLIHLVDRMLSLNKQLQEIGDKKTAQTAKLEEEIKKIDEEIDEMVYKLYGITEAEKKIIEESLK